MKRAAVILFGLLLSVYAMGQATTAERDAQREQLRQLLTSSAARTNIEFRQGEKNPYNFIGYLHAKVVTCDYIEVVVGVSENNTIRISAYPHLDGHYINLSDARNDAAFMRRLLIDNTGTFSIGAPTRPAISTRASTSLSNPAFPPRLWSSPCGALTAPTASLPA
jgi:hypothetical protein